MALRKRGLLLGHFRGRRAPVQEKLLQAFYLQRINLDLLPRHVQDFVVVQDLDICLRYVHADVVPGFFQVLQGGVQVQGRELALIIGCASVKEVHAGSDTETGGGGVSAFIRVVSAQAAAEVEVFAGLPAGLRQPGPTGRVLLHFLPLDAQLLLGQGKVVLHGPRGALGQRPGAGKVGPGGVGAGIQRQGYNQCFHNQLFII